VKEVARSAECSLISSTAQSWETLCHHWLNTFWTTASPRITMMRRTSFLQVAAAIIQNLFKHMESYSNLDILWEMEAVKLLTSPQGAISGVKVRKSDGLYDINSLNAMFACGGFEGN